MADAVNSSSIRDTFMGPPASEAESKRQSDLPFRIPGIQAEDAHEIPAGEAARRAAELRRVGYVAPFDPRLEPPAGSEREAPRNRQVQVHDAGPGELVEDGVAEAERARWLRPRR